MADFGVLEMVLGYLSCLATGFLVGRHALRTNFEKQMKKEIYEQGKLDGAFEFLRDSLFTTITKR
jgi:hypothetical protein